MANYDDNYALWTVNLISGKMQRVSVNGRDIDGRRIAWSPDGSRIAIGYFAPESPGELPSDIWLMNPDGSDLVNVTQTPNTVEYFPD